MSAVAPVAGTAQREYLWTADRGPGWTRMPGRAWMFG